MLKIYVTGVLLACGVQMAFAQKMVLISDSLTANADVLAATLDKSGWGSKFPKLNFGVYRVISGKWDLPGSSQTSNFLGTKTEAKSSRKFLFILTGEAGDTAKVSGIMKISSEAKSPLRVAKSVFVGSNQQIGWLDFSANITLTGDTSNVWNLSMKTESGGEMGKYEAFLTDGKRNIVITPAGVNNYVLPAYGYEFSEKDQFYSAYQFVGKTRSFQSLYKIYLDKRQDTKMKLVLSGAMVALLALKDGMN